MLKYRVITGIVLVLSVLAAIFFLSVIHFAIFFTAMIIYASYEWSQLMRLNAPYQRVIYVVLTCLLLAYLTYCFTISQVIHFAMVWWCVALLLVLVYPRFSSIWFGQKMLLALIGWCVLLPCWLAVLVIRQHVNGEYTLLFLLTMVSLADTSAYFAGRAFGRRPLLPRVSPGKTWVGFAAGITMSPLFAVPIFYYTGTPRSLWLTGMMVVGATVAWSIVGDLFESAVKRSANMKDSGSILPGHGGLLDRIDSLTAAAPAFLFLTSWLFQ